MNPPSTSWRCIIVLLIFSIKRCPLGPARSQRFNGHGYLTVEPARHFLIGSNLTVYCHVKECQPRSKISLALNDVTVTSWRIMNCTTVKFDLISVQEPQSIVICKLQNSNIPEVVGGLDLHGGLPPFKPDGIVCTTTKSSDVVSCSWKRGPDTYLPTTYTISVSRQNGTQIYFDQAQEAEEVTIPRRILDVNADYRLSITASNHFGESQCDPIMLRVQDIVMPETPNITQVFFVKNSMAAVLQWISPESSESLRPHIRLRTADGPWEVREGEELSKDVIRVEDLRPLMEYQFQMRTCESASDPMSTNSAGFTFRPTSTRTWFCSKWSESVRGKSPGKGPSKQLRVWRMLSKPTENGLRNVTVLWKPLSPDDYSGEVQHYGIFLADNQTQNVTCGATLTQFSIQAPANIQTLSVSAVTSYGTSPPAVVPLTHSDGFVPVLEDCVPVSNGSTALCSLSWPGTRQQSTSGEELLHYVVEWTSVAAAQFQWHNVAKDQNSTSITGLTAGVRYNISLYAVTTRGVSAPSSRLVYSKELKPASGPRINVLGHKARRIELQWDELPLNEQGGFITNYTVYIRQLHYGSAKLSVKVSGPRHMWIDCPDGDLVLHMTASTSAGEGPPGNTILSQPEEALPAHAGHRAASVNDLVIVIIFSITLFIAIIANLMCWSCVRKRVKEKFLSWGPAWLVENLPKPGNSNAIRLLKMDSSEPSFSYTHSDPPLSPISLISWEERDDVYPNIHVEISQFDLRQPTAKTPLLKSDCKTTLHGTQLEHVNYKPQVATLASQDEEVHEAEEEEGDLSASEEVDRCPGVFEGLLGGLLSSVEVDNSRLGLTLSSVGGLSWPKTSPVLSRGSLLVRSRAENVAEADSPCPRLQQSEIKTPDAWDTCTSYKVGTTPPCGYFPQIAAVSSPEVCEASRVNGSNGTRT